MNLPNERNLICMSKSLGKQLPPKVFDLLSYANKERKNLAIFLLVRDEEDYPHVALFSPFQVVASGPGTVYVGIHTGSRTQGFIKKWRKVTLVIQGEPEIYYVNCNASEVLDWSDPVDELYRLESTEALEDYSDTAPFTSELKFDAANVLPFYSEEFEYISKYAEEHK